MAELVVYPRVGQTYRVTNRTHGHGFKIGEIVHVETDPNHNGPFKNAEGDQWWLMPEEYELVLPPLDSIDQINQFLEENSDAST